MRVRGGALQVLWMSCVLVLGCTEAPPQRDQSPSFAGGAGSGGAAAGGAPLAGGSSLPGNPGASGNPGSPGAAGAAGGAVNPGGAAAGGNAMGAGASGGAAAGSGAGGMSGSSAAGSMAMAGSTAEPGAFGGYITSGGWKGFAWTATSMSGGMIMPANFGDKFDFPLCAKGMVNTGDSNVAMLGWNVNQATTPAMAPAMSVTPMLAGVTVKITNPAGSELRLQLQGPNGATSATDRWCAVIPGTGGFIPYDAFNTECWAGGKGTAYAKQPIVAAIVLVPGKAGATVSFDFCVNDIEETDASGMGAMTSSGCSLSGSPGEGGGSISGSDTRVVTRDGRQYVVQNNVWNGNSSNQTLTVTGTAFTVSQQSNGASTGGPPTSFPSVFVGSNFGHSASGSGLPKQVSALQSVQTGWKWSGSNGTHNATYDVWFSTGPGGDGGNPSGGYMMVWFQRHPDVVPLGGSPTGTVSIAGKSWQYWACMGGCQNGVPVISYIPPSGAFNEWSFDLKPFIDHAAMVGVIKKEWYLSNIFAGFEIWNGGQGLKTENFCAVVK